MFAPSARTKTFLWLALLLGAIAAAAILVGKNLTLAEIRAGSRVAADFVREHTALTAAALLLTQAVGMALCLPTKALVTLLSGALLGTVGGSAVTMAGVLLGTSGLFFAVRRMLRDRFLEASGERARKLEARLARRPIRAMAGLRLVITLPYGPITIAAALTTIRFRDFLIGSFLGDFLVVVLYCAAGGRLATLESLSDVLEPTTLAVFLGAAAVLLAATFLGKKKEEE